MIASNSCKAAAALARSSPVSRSHLSCSLLPTASGSRRLLTRSSPSLAPRLTSSFHSAPSCLAGRPPPQRAPEPKPSPLTLRNGDIPYKMVQLVDPETNTVGEAIDLRGILRQFDHDTHMLKLVSESPPIVKIVDIEEEKRKEREHEAKIKLAKRLSVEDKELQVGWHGAPSDLQHKIHNARHIIEKGDRVHVVFANRASGGKRPKAVPDARKAEIVLMFENGMSDIAAKWKEDERSAGLWISYWQPQTSIVKEVRQKVVGNLVDNKRKKEELKEARRLKEEERARKAKERQAEQAAKAKELLGKF